jgi:PAS domain S-box-containing protein
MRYLAVSRRYILDFRLPQDAQLIGRSHYEIFPDIPQRWRDVHARVLAGEELSQEEDQFTRQDGRTHWVGWSMAPWRRADGNIGGALLFSELRTEQVEARRALIDSEARFRATFENAAVGVAMVDPDGSILRANNSFARMLGYSVEELKTKTFQELTHPDDLATNLSVLNKALVGEADSYSIEKRYVRKDGGIVWASLTVGCVRKTDGVVDYFVSVIQDITDRRRAEARLAERNAQLDLAGKIARIGSFIYDDGTKRLQLSPGCAAIYGLPEGTLEISREDWRARVHPDDLTPLDAVARRAFTNGEREFVLEFRIFRHGQVRWIESRVLISYNEAGKPLRRIGAEIDVTERKQAEQALAERNIQLALAAKAGLVGSYAYDVDTGIKQISAGYAAIHGYPEGTTEIARSECIAGVYPDDIGRVEQSRSEAFRERRREFKVEYRIIRPGGEVRWVETRCFISYKGEGRPHRVVGVSIDITERKKAELALADRDALIGLAEKVTRVGNFTVDLNTGRVQLSAGCVAIHGFPEGTAEVRRDDWRAGVHPDDLARLSQLFSQAFTERWPEYKADYRIVRSGGEVRWIEARAVVSCDRNGLPERFIGVNIDVTERKTAEDALQRREAELAEAQRLAHIGNWSWDAATNRLVGSDELYRIYGWDPTRPIPNIREQLGRNYSSKDWERLRAVMRDTMQTGAGYVLDLQAFRNGTPMLVTTRGEAVRNGRGQIVGLRGTVQDITERKMAELALAERNIQLALAGKAARVGNFAYDHDTERMQISAGYAAIHGFPDGTTEIARSEWQLGVHPEDRVRWEALRSRAHRERWDEYSGEYRIVRSGSENRWIEARVFVSYDGDGRPRRAVGVDIDVTARKRAEEQQGTLNAELDHRVKNVLATVSAIAAHTKAASSSMDDFVVALDGRIRSMATTHELLSARRWHGVSLTELVRRELAPYATRNNTEIGGPEVTLSAEAGQVVSMVLHELTTNAAKHGALSGNDGQVSVHWHRASNGNADAPIAIEWQETGGPAVQAPDTCGYGMEVIRDVVPYELGGRVDLTFPADGLFCRLEIPAEWLSNGTRSCGTVNGAGRPLHGVP